MSAERLEDIEKICLKCERSITDHPTTGRINTIILYGSECAWNPDKQFRGFVARTLKNSGYDLENFGLEKS